MKESEIIRVEASAYPPMMDSKWIGKLPPASKSTSQTLIVQDGRWLEGCIHCFMGKHWESFQVHFERVVFCLKRGDGTVLWWADWKQDGYQEGT